MKESPQPEFDRYAKKYTDLHRDSIKASGEDPVYFASYKAKYMASRLGSGSLDKPLALLDFGCGIGNTTSHLHQAFPKAVLHGADLSGESIQLAEQAYSNIATFRVIDHSHIPYADHSFDVVMAACVFHHIPPGERAHWMSEIRRVSKPHATVFIFEHNVLNPLTVKAVKDCPFDEDAILLPRKELTALADLVGLQDITARYIVFFPHALRLFRPLESFLNWIPFGAQYVVEAKV